jgi:hypothetical protein
VSAHDTPVSFRPSPTSERPAPGLKRHVPTSARLTGTLLGDASILTGAIPHDLHGPAEPLSYPFADGGVS